MHTHGGAPDWLLPIKWAQQRGLHNAACQTSGTPDAVASYVLPLVERMALVPEGIKLVILALDGYHDASGKLRPEHTHFMLSNDWCALAAQGWPERLEWAASVHPYRADAQDELARVRRLGARAIKWIPSAQGIDPASPLCDRFFRALVGQGLPLITHGGEQRATTGDDALGNPLRLRRALDAGVRVIVAHCASMGESADIDRGPGGPATANFDLFKRLMAEPRYSTLLLGDLSAIGQRARSGPVLAELLRQAAPGAPWSKRIVFGTDYPIPAVMPLYSTQELCDQGLLAQELVAPLRELRRHNAWAYDFVLKRHLRWQGLGFAPEVFATRRVLAQ